MSGTDAFFDTNVVLYLFSADAAKADRAEILLAQGGTVSVQVLNEIVSVARRKLAMTWSEVHDVLIHIRAVCHVVPLTAETHGRAVVIAERYRLSIYDATILASALDARCSVVYTEDLQHGQRLEDAVTVCNPFWSEAKE